MIDKNKKLGVVRFLQIKQQNFYVEKLMKRNYAGEAHTIDEWDQKVIELLDTKVKANGGR